MIKPRMDNLELRKTGAYDQEIETNSYFNYDKDTDTLTPVTDDEVNLNLKLNFYEYHTDKIHMDDDDAELLFPENDSSFFISNTSVQLVSGGVYFGCGSGEAGGNWWSKRRNNI